MSIVTISREFGSGGREVGKRLADALGFAYYDREIVTTIAQKNRLDEDYVASALSRGLYRNIPVHFGRTFTYSPAMISTTTNLFVEQNRIIRELAEAGDCIIVGRAAGVILQEHDPFSLFVYADMDSKVRRCQARASADEVLTDREMERRIKKIDAERARYHELFSSFSWGDKAGYDLCLNTTGMEIKAMIPSLAEYIRCWFAHRA